MLEAKDTVINTPKHSETTTCPHCHEDFGIESYVEGVKIQQAEISFSAGEKQGYEKAKQEKCEHCDTPLMRDGERAELIEQGMKKVRDFIDSHEEYFSPNFFLKWQAFLKDNGLED